MQTSISCSPPSYAFSNILTGPVILLVPAISIAVLLTLGAKEWLMGRRAEALHYFDRCATVLIMLGVIWGLAWISSIVYAKIYGETVDIFDLASVTVLLSKAAGKFEEMWKTAYTWVLNIGMMRATFIAIPFLQPVSEILGSVLLWQNWALSIAATSLLVMVLITKMFSMIANWLLCIGATLTATDTLRKVGAGLLSIYIATAVGIPVLANEAYKFYSDIAGTDINPPNSVSTSTVGTPTLNMTCPDVIEVRVGSSTTAALRVNGKVEEVGITVDPSIFDNSISLGIYPSEGNLPLIATLTVTATDRATPGDYSTIIRVRGGNETISKRVIVKVIGASNDSETNPNIINIADITAKISWKLISIVIMCSLGLSIIIAVSAGMTWMLGGVGTISIRRYI